MILVIDNYDSFTYNLVQYLGQCGHEALVKRNDKIDLEEVLRLRPTGIMLSPGPCTPAESGVCLPILEWALQQEDPHAVPSIFGVCLGHQAMGYVAGAKIERARNIRHGKTSMVEHDGLGLVKGLPNPFQAIRYHSLVIAKDTVPGCFVISAVAQDDGEIMGIRHRYLPIEGVQFHPESVLTEGGIRIVENFVTSLRSAANLT